MTDAPKPAPEDIRRARTENPALHERDLAQKLGVSEADYVAAHCGHGATRIEVDVDTLLAEAGTLGEVMALTRNESAVHEKIGVYENAKPGRQAAMVLGSDIDLRIFPGAWAHGFAVEKHGEDGVRRSLQFFDAAGDAVHKIHLRPASDVDAYLALVERMRSVDQAQAIETTVGPASRSKSEATPGSRDELREKWEAMTDVHQFFGILRSLNLTRRQALSMVGDDLAWRLDRDAVSAMMMQAAQEEMPIMCFVGNKGCIQIHSGPVANIKTMGPWLNVMDPGFHLHLRTDRIAELWSVRKPNSDGHVTSLEAYDADGTMVIQFFGKRHEGKNERPDWRRLAEQLPRLPDRTAA